MAKFYHDACGGQGRSVKLNGLLSPKFWLFLACAASKRGSSIVDNYSTKKLGIIGEIVFTSFSS